MGERVDRGRIGRGKACLAARVKYFKGSGENGDFMYSPALTTYPVRYIL